MKRVDAYLSRRAKGLYPDAVVYCDDSGAKQVWTCERAGQEPLGLGSSFQEARAAMSVLVNAHRPRSPERDPRNQPPDRSSTGNENARQW